MPPKKENSGCGCSSIPISFLIILLGGGYWGFTQLANLGIAKLLPDNIAKLLPDNIGSLLPNNQQTTPIAQQSTAPILSPTPTQRIPVANSPAPQIPPIEAPTAKPQASPLPVVPRKSSLQAGWEKKSNQRNLFKSVSSHE